MKDTTWINPLSLLPYYRTDEFEGVRVADGFVPNDMPGGGPTMSPGTPKSYYPSAEYQAQVAEDGR